MTALPRLEAIKEMPAGEAIEQLVAVEVLGYRRGQDLVDGITRRPQFVPPGGDYRDASPMVPPSSRNIASAWLVLEAVHARGWYVIVGLMDQPGWCRCMAHRTPDDIDATAPSAPLAICRAALGAVRTPAP